MKQLWLAWIISLVVVQFQITVFGSETVHAVKEAEKLVEIMNMDELFQRSLRAAVEPQISRNPSIGPAIEQFFRKVLSWEVIAPEFAKIYAEEFSESELADAIQFYQSPTGKKFVSKQFALMKRGQEIVAAVMEKHMPELQEIMSPLHAEAWENAAIASIRVIGSGCLLYRATAGEFPPSLEAMREGDIIDSKLASGIKGGYQFTYTREKRGFSATAIPLKTVETGRRRFFVDETQVIRYSERDVPGPSSPIIQGSK